MSSVSLPIACLDELERLALEVTGIRFVRAARDRAEAALVRMMDERGERDCDRMMALLGDERTGAELIERIVGEVTTKETYLFRDPAQFDFLRASILPEAAEAIRATEGVLRVWSAGCATGEEAYSVAMLLAEMPEVASVVLGTDISESAIRVARAGMCTGMRLAPDAGRYGPLVERWTRVTPAGLGFADEIRSRVRFTTHNLVRDLPPNGQHIVLCRNVMIYLPAGMQQRLVQTLWRSVLPGGRLLLGEAELLHIVEHDFQRLPVDGAVIYEKPTRGGGRG